MAYKGSGDEYLHSPPTAIYMQKKEVAGGLLLFCVAPPKNSNDKTKQTSYKWYKKVYHSEWCMCNKQGRNCPGKIRRQTKAGDYVGNNNNEESKPDGS